MEHLDEGTVHAWLDGALSADEGRRVEEHASSCSECSALVAEARGLIAASSRILSALDDVPRVQTTEAKAPTAQSAGQGSSAPALRVERADARAPRRPWWARPQLSAAAVLAVVALGSFVVARNRERAIPADLRAPSMSAAPVAEAGASSAAPAPDSLAAKADVASTTSAQQSGARERPLAEAPRREGPKATSVPPTSPNEAKKDARAMAGASGGTARGDNASAEQRAAGNLAVAAPAVAPPVVAAKTINDSAASQLSDRETARAQREEPKVLSRSLDPNHVANIEKKRVLNEPLIQNVVVTGAASVAAVRASDVVACWSLQRNAAAANAGVPSHIELTKQVVRKENGREEYAVRALGAEADKSETWRWSIGPHGDVLLLRGFGDAVVRVPLSTTGARNSTESTEITIATRQACVVR